MNRTENKKVKILYALEAAEAGALKHLTYLVTHLDKRFFDITVLLSPRSPRAFKSIEVMRHAGANVILMQMNRELNIWRDLVTLAKAFNHLRKNPYDIVHAHSSKAGFFFRIPAFIFRVPLILYTPHCFFFQSKFGWKRVLFACIERVLSLLTDYIILSKGEKEVSIKNNIVKPEKILNINNAIDFNEYKIVPSKDARQDLGIGKNTIVVGAIGRLVEQKGFMTLIDTASQVLKSGLDVTFLIAGEGELLNAIKKRITALNLNSRVILMGYSNDISKLFAALDIFVTTSLWEGLPYVILEAMWFKKPILATNLGYDGILRDNSNGFVVPVDDTDSISNALDILIRNRDLCETMGENGFQLLKSESSFEIFLLKHQNLYLSVRD